MEIVCSNCSTTAEGRFCPNCGHILAAATQKTVDTDATLKVLVKAFGVQEFVQIILSVHTPIRRIRALLASGNLLLSCVVTAYIEMVTLIPFFHKQITLRFGQAVSYPLIAQGEAIENNILFYLVAAIGAGLGLATIYVLPKRLFEPTNRATLLAVNLQIAMYTVIYFFIADLIKITMWAFTNSFSLVNVFGWAMLIVFTILPVYIWRRVLTLRWLTIVLLLVIANVASFVQGFILASTGLLRF